MAEEKAAIRRFFHEYVFGFIRSDIEREISLAREGRGGGNLLAALGLLCYTEVLGAFVRQNLELKVDPNRPARGPGQARKNFDAFFATLGGGGERSRGYQALLAQTVKVYDIFRCGMAHEYETKEPCEVVMVSDPAAPCGIIAVSSGYRFLVDRYYADFMLAAWNLYDTLMAMTSPIRPQTSEKKPRCATTPTA